MNFQPLGTKVLVKHGEEE
nr:10 kda heat shock- and alkaline pH-induced protein/GroES homolog {N-terminal} [Campylobacter jejuni, 81176, serotype 23/26, Lior serotype 5, Peptide Partial, 18 aa] [Campylobacter jejuni]